MNMMGVLQQSLELGAIGEGQAILIVGILGLLLAASVRFANPTAGIAWGVSVMLLVMSGLLDLGMEIFWLAVVATITVLVAGLVVRWAY